MIYRKSLQSEIESLQSELRAAHQHSSEEKSLRLHAESKIQTLDAELQARADDMAMLQSQVDDYRSSVEERTQQVSAEGRSYIGSNILSDDGFDHL
jgi:septal ring factor EnvC (AmiA/AmiB activator)